jgi:hypothetical protein
VMMPAAAMEPVVSAMMTPVVSAVMPAASGCFGRGEHCRAEHRGGAKDHEIMHWASHFRRCGRRERIAATLIKHIFWGAAITLMTDDNEPTLSGSLEGASRGDLFPEQGRPPRLSWKSPGARPSAAARRISRAKYCRETGARFSPR